jgi:hypothetical protein
MEPAHGFWKDDHGGASPPPLSVMTPNMVLPNPRPLDEGLHVVLLLAQPTKKLEDVVIPSHYPNVIFSLANNRTSVNLFY